MNHACNPDRSIDARNQAATAGSAVAVACNRHAVIFKLLIAFHDEVRIRIRVLRTIHKIADARYRYPSKLHPSRRRNYLTAVIGSIAKTNYILHLAPPLAPSESTEP
jgi:hypothetical protein